MPGRLFSSRKFASTVPSRKKIPSSLPVHMLITHPQPKGADVGEVHTDNVVYKEVSQSQFAHWTHPPHDGPPPSREVERNEALA
eukprot:41410-Chlamydomonas_euryale.AAC.1